MWVELAATGVLALTAEINDPRKRELAATAAVLGRQAWSNGYGRDQEDQADRVGLRYAYEAGFDIRKAPGFWRRQARQHREPGPLQNFFFGSHSLSDQRAANLEREIALNYRSGSKLPHATAAEPLLQRPVSPLAPQPALPPAAGFQSQLGFSARIPSGWKVLNATTLRRDPRLVDLLGGLNEANRTRAVQALRAGQLEVYFAPMDAGSRFRNHVRVIRVPGMLPNTEQELASWCRGYASRLAKAGGGLRLDRCRADRHSGRRALYVERDGSVPGTRVIEYRIQERSEVILQMTGSWESRVAASFPKELGRLVRSMRVP
jgi:hypothetical protein